MKKIIFLRHSNTNIEPEKYNPLWSLSDLGIENAEKLKTNPLLEDIEVLYTSNQIKAIHTGVIVASELNVFLKQEDNLTELTSLTNDWIDDYPKFIEDIYTGKIERMNGGETLEEARIRFTNTVDEIVKTEPDKEVIGIVAHCNVLALYASQFEDRGALEIHHSIEMPDIAVLDWESKTFDIRFGNHEKN